MRSVAPFEVLVAFSLAGFSTLNPNASGYLDIRGTYELVSFNGRTLPVDMGNGEILAGGICGLSASAQLRAIRS